MLARQALEAIGIVAGQCGTDHALSPRGGGLAPYTTWTGAVPARDALRGSPHQEHSGLPLLTEERTKIIDADDTELSRRLDASWGRALIFRHGIRDCTRLHVLPLDLTPWKVCWRSARVAQVLGGRGVDPSLG